MLDFTREIKLNNVWNKKFAYSRIFVFFVFLAVGVFVLYRILFPSASFDFFFATPNAAKNTITLPRENNGTIYQNGKIENEKGLIFDSGVFGNFSNLKVILSKKNDYFTKIEGSIKARKSFQAFFYPTGEPMPFKNGTLLKNNSKYYIVSENKLRLFSSETVVSEFGYDKKSFIEIDFDELQLNQMGYDISQTSAYPEDTLFHIGDEYFQLKNKSLVGFISEKAFLSRYELSQAIEKDETFLDSIGVSEDYIGFSDGALLSADDSVYIVSGNSIYPIYDPATFESMGYIWDDVIPANSEEISIYEKEKIFTIKNPHPNGTIFRTSDSEKYFYVKDKEKRELRGEKILSTYLRLTPVIIEEKSLNEYTSCRIEPRFRIFGSYECNIDLENIKDLNGNDYQFETNIQNDVELSTLNVNFYQVLNIKNMRNSISILKKRVGDNYNTQ